MECCARVTIISFKTAWLLAGDHPDQACWHSLGPPASLSQTEGILSQVHMIWGDTRVHGGGRSAQVSCDPLLAAGESSLNNTLLVWDLCYLAAPFRACLHPSDAFNNCVLVGPWRTKHRRVTCGRNRQTEMTEIPAANDQRKRTLGGKQAVTQSKMGKGTREWESRAIKVNLAFTSKFLPRETSWLFFFPFQKHLFYKTKI